MTAKYLADWQHDWSADWTGLCMCTLVCQKLPELSVIPAAVEGLPRILSQIQNLLKRLLLIKISQVWLMSKSCNNSLVHMSILCNIFSSCLSCNYHTLSYIPFYSSMNNMLCALSTYFNSLRLKEGVYSLYRISTLCTKLSAPIAEWQEDQSWRPLVCLYMQNLMPPLSFDPWPSWCHQSAQDYITIYG